MHVSDDFTEGLKAGKTAVIDQFYRQFFADNTIFILENKGSISDARSIFKQALAMLIEVLQDSTCTLNTSTQNYHKLLCRQLWLQAIATSQRHPLAVQDQLQAVRKQISNYILAIGDRKTSTKADSIHTIFDQLDEACQTLLIDFYYRKLPLRTIGKQMSCSRNSVIVKKKHCMDHLKKKVQYLQQLNQLNTDET